MKLLNTTLHIISASKKIYFWCFFAVLVILSLFMLYSYKLYPSFDFYFHFKRFNVLIEALRDGTFPIYIDNTAANGYGYATKWFYSDFIFIPFALIGLITNAVFAYQVMIFTMTVLCGTLMYYVINRIFENKYAASVSAILFTFCTYRLADLYIRSAMGEALSFTFLPIVFLGLYEIIRGDYKKWYILTIGYSLMIFTHVLSTFLMFITTLIILVICYKSFVKEPKRSYYLLLSGFATLILTAYFLYPMLEQMLSGSFYYQTVVKAHPDDHKQGLNWIIWGMFEGIIHPKQLFIPGIGILLTWGISLRLFVTEKRTIALKAVDAGVILGFVFVMLLSSIIPWTIFPFNKLIFIQLPWRLYEFISFFFAIAGGYYLASILKSDKRRFIGLFLIVLCTLFVISSSGRDYQFENSQRDIYEIPTKETNNYHLYGMEYFPSKVPSLDYIDKRGDRVDTQNYETKISNFNKSKGITSFSVEVNTNDVVELPLFYYKGYKAMLNNKDIPVEESENGLINIPISQSGNIKVYYAGTTLQKISPYISLIAFIGLFIYIFIQHRNRRKNILY